jgi:cbb3-type cytochrome oxidase subunit 3
MTNQNNSQSHTPSPMPDPKRPVFRNLNPHHIANTDWLRTKKQLDSDLNREYHIAGHRPISSGLKYTIALGLTALTLCTLGYINNLYNTQHKQESEIRVLQNASFQNISFPQNLEAALDTAIANYKGNKRSTQFSTYRESTPITHDPYEPTQPPIEIRRATPITNPNQ